MNKPSSTPLNPCFSSGPCAKRPGWTVEALSDTPIGRSHRATVSKNKIKQVIDRSRRILNIPDDYVVGLVPGSDTGAYEMAMWTLLGSRPVEMLAWESFGEGWVTDVVKQLDLDDAIVKRAEYGQIPDLASVNWDHDVCFTWNGTTSGACVPDGNWIDDTRKGLAICDATSAVFAMDLPMEKLDVVTWSWQKVMGGEGAHGMIALSPRAVERLENHKPQWPLPKLFRLTKGGKLIKGIFEGATINTPSMLCVEDALDGLKWAESIGGLNALIKRSQSNLSMVEKWVAETPWVTFLADNPAHRSCTSICLSIVDDWFASLETSQQYAVTKHMSAMLEKEDVAYDINGYRDAPAGLRLWGGATVNSSDMQAVLPWLTYAFEHTKTTMVQQAA